MKYLLPQFSATAARSAILRGFRSKEPRPLIAHLVALSLTLVAPLLIVCAVLLGQYVTSTRENLEAVAQRAVETIVTSIDEDLAAKIATLQVLATSPALRVADFPLFEQQLRELQFKFGQNIVLREPGGQQIVNTLLPSGAKLPSGTNSGADEVVRNTLEPYISNLFIGVATQEWLVAVAVPVIIEGHLRYILGVNVPVAHYESILRQKAPDRPYSTAISDRKGLMIARSTQSAKFTGLPLPGFEDCLGQSGIWNGVNPEGVPVFRQYKRSGLTGWLVSMGTQKAALEDPLWRTVYFGASLAFVLVVAGAFISAWSAGTIVSAIEQLGAISTKLTGEGLIEPPHTALTEANRIGAELAAASSKLNLQSSLLERANEDLENEVASRTRDLEEKTALLEVTLENMDQGLILIDPDRNVPIHNRRAVELLSLPEALMNASPKFSDVIERQLHDVDAAKAEHLRRVWLGFDTPERGRHSFEWRCENGTVLEINTVPISTGGAVQTFTDITVRKEADERIEHLANHDALTGIANRMLLMTTLRQSFSRLERNGEEFAVHLLDLDFFKEVNDTLGHDAGDALIRMVADRLRKSLRQMDVVARLGGDEFAIIQQLKSKNDAAGLARRILDDLRQPYQIGANQVVIGVSIGIAIAPAHGSTPIDILKSADMAMYRTKSNGRNAFGFFDEAMEHEARQRSALVKDLRSAVANGELHLQYQTIFDIKGLNPAAVEALVRWKHPKQGLISPGLFIPLAEEAGFIAELGEWILRRACRDAVSLPAHVKVAVNFSPGQFLRGDIWSVVERALLESGLAPTRLEIEITETLLLEKQDTILEDLRALRALGVAIVLDDFGTGYSSLSYLQLFPFDKIKIDRSFVAELPNRNESAAIIRAVTDLARALNMTTTAEGVETEEQYFLLKKANCCFAQGYLFSRPKPLAEINLIPESISKVA